MTATKLIFDPDLLSEVTLSCILTFLYPGVVKLNKDSEGLDEISVEISKLLNLPKLRIICQSTQKGEESCPNVNTACENYNYHQTTVSEQVSVSVDYILPC